MSASELRRREVVNALTAERLGFVSDLDIDYETGCIRAVIVPKKRRLSRLFSGDNEYVIPWSDIVAMGTDIILVRLSDTQQGEACGKIQGICKTYLP